MGYGTVEQRGLRSLLVPAWNYLPFAPKIGKENQNPSVVAGDVSPVDTIFLAPLNCPHLPSRASKTSFSLCRRLSQEEGGREGTNKKPHNRHMAYNQGECATNTPDQEAVSLTLQELSPLIPQGHIFVVTTKVLPHHLKGLPCPVPLEDWKRSYCGQAA